MIKRCFVAVVLLLMAFFVSAAYCQDDAETLKTVDGSVISVDPQNSIISVHATEDFTFFVSPGARITNADGFSIQLSDINAGNYVMVGYYNDASGRRIANNINVEYNN